jgi:Zn-dependent M28 family amino/carboxypeptidase
VYIHQLTFILLFSFCSLLAAANFATGQTVAPKTDQTRRLDELQSRLLHLQSQVEEKEKQLSAEKEKAIETLEQMQDSLARFKELDERVKVLIKEKQDHLLSSEEQQPANESQPTELQQHAAKTHITETSLRADVQFLADDLLEGRGPGTRGDLLAQQYIISQFKLSGLQPAANGPVAIGPVATAGNVWVQEVPLIGVTTRPPASLTFTHGEKSLSLNNHDDYVVTCGNPKQSANQTKPDSAESTAAVAFQDAEIVFVGYGIQAPEFDWDDFKDVDVRGKVLLIMNNDPADDPELFAGRTRLYYGRWDYKYAKAAERGAIGALIIHTTPSAGYPFQVVQTSWTGEQMALGGDQAGRLPMEGWLSDDAAHKLVQLAGQDLESLRNSAERRDFRPVPLGIKLSIDLKYRLRKRSTGNVLGLLPGSDPELSKQCLVFTAHHDHIGIAETRDERGDNIYNGAVDNASGVAAMLSIVRAMASLPESQRPKRSILFAAVGAEEQGLLGSKYLALNPPIPAGQMAAVINIDGINILGPTEDVVVVGRGKSDMDQLVEQIANWQKRVVVDDQFPDRGHYYRSDQFSLAKVGVPGVYLSSGVHVRGKPDGWGKQKLQEWTENIYHQTSDEYSDDWDLRGAVEDTQLLFYVGLLAANQSKLPAWKSGDEFEAARAAALANKK